MISLDATASLIETGFAAGGARVWSHVCNGENRTLVVSVMLFQDVSGTGTISAMTYAGVTMTKATEKTVTAGTMRSEIWYLHNPAIGSNSISATVSGNTDDRKFVSSSWNGKDIRVTTDATQTAEGGASPVTLSITTVAFECVVIDAVMNFSTDALTVGGGQSTLLNNATGSTSGASSYEFATTPTAVTMSWTKAGSDDWAQCAVSLKSAQTKSLPNRIRPRIFRPGIAR